MPNCPPDTKTDVITNRRCYYKQDVKIIKMSDSCCPYCPVLVLHVCPIGCIFALDTTVHRVKYTVLGVVLEQIQALFDDQRHIQLQKHGQWTQLASCLQC